MKKFGMRLLAAIVASSLIVTPVMAAPSINQLEASKSQAQSEVNSLQSKLKDIIKKLSKLEKQLVKTGEKIIQATKDLEAAEAKEQQQYESMKIRIKYMYEQGEVDAVEALITAMNFTDLINKAEYISNVHQYDRKKLEEYIATKQEVADLKATLEKEEKELEASQKEYEKKEDELKNLIDKKKAEVADLDQQLQAAIEAAAQIQIQEEAAENGGNGNGDGSAQTTPGGTQSKPATGGDSSAASRIVSVAYGQLGTKYVWGGSSPSSGFDCSGLVAYCHSRAGVSMAHSSYVQAGGGSSVSSPKPGDVVCWPGHVGIYIGGGQMIHAPKPGDVVKVASVSVIGGTPSYRRYW